MPVPLIVSTGTSIREVLDRSLARTGEAFHQDAVLVDDRYGPIGPIKAETLARLVDVCSSTMLAAGLGPGGPQET